MYCSIMYMYYHIDLYHVPRGTYIYVVYADYILNILIILIMNNTNNYNYVLILKINIL